jgi:protein-tyrosine-phosphatase
MYNSVIVLSLHLAVECLAMKILVLCLGNINRSPLCCEILRRAGYEVDSAGFRKTGQPATKKTRQWAWQNLNLDLHHHRSKVVTEGMLEEANLIVLMTPKHRRNIITCPAEKTTLLGHHLDPPRDTIPDPNYLAKDSPEFDRALQMVVDATNGLIRYLES